MTTYLEAFKMLMFIETTQKNKIAQTWTQPQHSAYKTQHFLQQVGCPNRIASARDFPLIVLLLFEREFHVGINETIQNMLKKHSVNKFWICFHYLATESITWYIVGRHLCFGPFFLPPTTVEILTPSENVQKNGAWDHWLSFWLSNQKNNHMSHDILWVIVTRKWYHDLQTWRWTLCMLERCHTIKHQTASVEQCSKP